MWCSVQFSSVAKLYLTLWDPMNRSTPGLPVHHQLLESTQTHVHCVGDAIQPSHPRSSPSPALNGMVSSVQSLSCVRLCDPMNRSTPGLPVHHHLPEFTQTHVHWVSDAIQPSHPLSSPSPPAPNPSQHQSLFQWVNSSLIHKKEWNPAICNSMDGPWRYYAKWNKSKTNTLCFHSDVGSKKMNEQNENKNKLGHREQISGYKRGSWLGEGESVKWVRWANCMVTDGS